MGKREKVLHAKLAGRKLQDVVNEVCEVDPESGKMFQEAVDVGQIEDYWHAASPFSKGVVGLDFTSTPPEITEAILLKMSSAFDMAYQRFQDLQEAEQRRKEAELEAAVERVRAHAMGMQTTEDLSNVLQVLNNELSKLDLEGQNSAYIWLFNEEGTVDGINLDLRETEADFKIYSNTFDPQEFRHFFKPIADDWEKNPEYSVTYTGPENIRGHIEEMANSDNQAFNNYAFMAQKAIDSGILAKNWSASSGFGNGLLGCDFQKEPTDWTEKVIRKMASAFGMAYKRFEDLKKAEAQTQETKIELALERVRARTMAMQNSNELADVAFVLFEQLRGLGGNLWGTGFGLCEENKELDVFWFANENGVLPRISIPNTVDPAHKKMYEGWKNDKDLLSIEGSGKDLKVHYEYFMTLPEVRPIFQKILDDGLSFPDWQQWNAAYFRHGYLLIITLEPYPDPDILVRFAKVFEQTYTRFLDLKKAEAQVRESEVQLALERVRAKSMAMHKSEDLADLSLELVQQVHSLGIDTWFCAFNIYDDHPEGSLEWGSNGQGVFPKYRTPREGVFLRYYEAGQNGESLLINEIDENECPAHYDYLCSLPGVGEQLLKIKAEGISFPKSQIDHAAFFKYGYILFITFEPAPEAHNIFKRFAQVFEQTYTRFLDLQNAEEQAYEAKIETSLERIRSHSMGMQKSEDLAEVVRQTKIEIMELGIQVDNTQIATDFTSDPYDGLNDWISDEGERYLKKFHIPFIEHPVTAKFYETRENDRGYFTVKYSKPEKNAYFKLLFEHSDFKDTPEERKKFVYSTPGWVICGVISTNSSMQFARYNLEMFSHEEIDVFKRFGKVFEQAYTRFLDLQKAEAQAREAKIEAALEKVRSRTMGMQSSDELPEVANLLFLEVQALGIPAWSCGYNILNDDKKSAVAWMSSEGTLQEPFKLRLFGEASFDEMGEFVLSDEPIFVQELGGKELEEHYTHMKSFSDLRPTFENIEAQGHSLPTYQINHLCKFSHGFLLFITYEKVPEAHDIFKRFTKVFDQTYTRFLDLKKAEKQARESQIEAALERVRARSMGMQKSGELIEVVRQIGKEVSEMDIEVQYSQIWTDFSTDPDDGLNIWVDVNGQSYLEKFHIPFVDQPITSEFYEALEKNLDFFSDRYSKSEKDQFFRFLFKNSDLKSIPQERKDLTLNAPGWIRFTVILNNSCLHFGRYNLNEFTEEEKEIFIRLGKVFGQAYTRFLDLQKAEEQAREAQIGNALEKVRSRSLAMQNPDELIEVAQLLREEMGSLGVEELETSSIYIHDESNGLTQCWFTIKDADDSGKSVTDQMTIDLQDSWVGRQMHQFYDSGQDSTSILMKGDHRIEWIRYCEKKSDLFGKSEFYGESIPERTYHLYKFSNGFLGAASPGDISEESWDLMKRATGVFSFAYTRFRDLQKAEESARRTRQQASLDRVRADISSMRSAEDLNRVTPLIWSELTTLGIPFIRCGVFIVHEETEEVEVYLSKPDGTSLAVMHLPFGSNELTFETVDSWRNKEVYIQHWSQEEFLEWGRSMMEQNQVADMKTYQGAEEAPESLHLHFIPFNQGMLYVGSTGALDDVEISLSESLAKAFSIAYARYEDFVKLEKAKAGIEDALAELKATQSQLVQQEKLASLGQLTAGIAHEIKNPLNFVNNFSEVSVELIEETKEELSAVSNQLSAEDREKVDEALEILNGIEINLRKIHEHGSRADSIVKSMLEHSRGGTGKPEATDLNSLVKEFVNLSFHGMRASKTPINVDLKFELEDSVKEVPLIAEDFSRVIVNLSNNAFDAMRDKLSAVSDQASASYKPKLTVRTSSENGKVAVEIEDNGPGIPEDMKDKILQPFFTTKKGTEGTGLGLSITNDIIKAHGGKLSINTTPEKGSTFRISIPR
jgi:signal transduction histidine kinase